MKKYLYLVMFVLVLIAITFIFALCLSMCSCRGKGKDNSKEVKVDSGYFQSWEVGGNITSDTSGETRFYLKGLDDDSLGIMLDTFRPIKFYAGALRVGVATPAMSLIDTTNIITKHPGEGHAEWFLPLANGDTLRWGRAGITRGGFATIGYRTDTGFVVTNIIIPKDNPLFRKGEKYRYDTSLKALKGIKDDSKD